MSLTECNRLIVQRFVELFYAQKNIRLAFENCVAEDYVQHNPGILDGREAAIVALEPMFSRPDSRFDVKHILVDGDFAAVHLHGKSAGGEAGGAVVDLFRLENGLIVEHWDVLQPIPANPINPHPMF